MRYSRFSSSEVVLFLTPPLLLVSTYLGYLYPAAGFAIWHFAPQSVFSSTAPGGSVALVVVAGVVGLMWGWVAQRTGSLRWVIVSHVLFDFSGLGGRIYF